MMQREAKQQATERGAEKIQDTEWQRPYQDSPGPDTLAQTPEPFEPQREGDSPGKVPNTPPAEPPNPNPVHVPPGGPQPGDLPASNPDVIATDLGEDSDEDPEENPAGNLADPIVGEEALDRAGAEAGAVNAPQVVPPASRFDCERVLLHARYLRLNCDKHFHPRRLEAATHTPGG
jgi:hypothetical protein